MLVGDAPGRLEQVGLGLRRRVEHFLSRVVDLGYAAFLATVAVVDAIAVLAFLAGKVVALVALRIGGDQVQMLVAVGEGGAAGLGLGAEQAAAVIVRHAAEILGLRTGAAVLRGDAVVPDVAGEAHAEVLAVDQDVLDADGAHFHAAADRARAGRGTLVDGHAADQVGIDVAALLGAGVAAVDVQRLLRAVDPHRHPALPLDAADVDVQRATVAAVADLYARDALEQVTHGNPAEAVDVFAGEVHRRAWRGIGFLLRIGQLGGRDHHRRQVGRGFSGHARLDQQVGAGGSRRDLQAGVRQDSLQAFQYAVATLERRRRAAAGQLGVEGQQQARLAGEGAQGGAQRTRRDVVAARRGVVQAGSRAVLADALRVGQAAAEQAGADRRQAEQGAAQGKGERGEARQGTRQAGDRAL